MSSTITSQAYSYNEAVKRVWNVGSYSGGMTLIGIGVVFMISLWKNDNAYELLLWLVPIVFLILGIELIVVSSARIQQEYDIRYNWLGMTFVGFVGVGALLIAALLSTGILQEVNGVFHIKERQIVVDQTTLELAPEVKKVDITSNYGYEIHKHANINEVTLLGNLTYHSEQPANLIDQQFMHAKTIGDTLYIIINNLEYDENRLNHANVRSYLTLTIPEHLEVIE